MPQLKKGLFVLYKDKPHQIVDVSHHAMGRGRGILNLKLKNLENGAVLNLTVKSAEAPTPIEVNQRTYQYLYHDNQYAYFMDSETYEQVQLDIKIVEDDLRFLKEGEEYQLYLYEGKPVAINMPKVVTLKVVKAAPGVKGDSSANPTKEVELETGLKLQVPLFIKEGDLIKVNTERVEYVERVQ